mmetsp:Transcript_19967/g.47355  ORF Transcript_19967/g.47355 Transcript_19967/m.47355 type:complete len:245 (+) Transcript_19967:317-1051(+)
MQAVSHRRDARGGRQAGGGEFLATRVVDELVRLTHHADVGGAHRTVARREQPRHRRVLPVGTGGVRVGHEQRQASWPTCHRLAQQRLLRLRRVGREGLPQQVGPGAEDGEETACQQKVRLCNRHRDLATRAHVLLVVVAVAEDGALEAEVGEGRRGGRREPLPDEIARGDDRDGRLIGADVGLEAHRAQPRERVALPAAAVRDDDDLLLPPLQLAHGLDRALVRSLAVVDHTELIEQKRVVLVG